VGRSLLLRIVPPAPVAKPAVQLVADTSPSQQPPYSCRQYWELQKNCGAYYGNCDDLKAQEYYLKALKYWRESCLHDGGQP
jgi:hypothetical protein